MPDAPEPEHVYIDEDLTFEVEVEQLRRFYPEDEYTLQEATKALCEDIMNGEVLLKDFSAVMYCGEVSPADWVRAPIKRTEETPTEEDEDA